MLIVRYSCKPFLGFRVVHRQATGGNDALGAYYTYVTKVAFTHVARICAAIKPKNYSSTAFMRLTPADDDCSFTIRNLPSSPV